MQGNGKEKEIKTMEDINNTETNKVVVELAEKNKTNENVTDSDTLTEVYVHQFEKPYKFDGKTYTKLEFNFEKLIGTDLVNIENEMAAVGEFAISPEISTSFLYRLAARAAGVGSDVISSLPLREFNKIKNQSRDFLISVGF